MKKELVIVIDFGGQYNQLVARRVRECNVYCEIYSYKTDLEKIKAMKKEISEDEIKKAEEDVQKKVDDYIKKVDKIVVEKEKDIMKV